MSIPQLPKPAKLIIGMFMNDKDLLEPVMTELSTRFGLVDMVSAWFDFNYTEYYKSEMGRPLFRRMLVFKELIKQSDLAGIKVLTNRLEVKYSTSSKRNINIDPGYLLHERFVLATGKNFTHRIFIGKGIYADLTLIFQKGTFQTLPWTYPDYAAQDMIDYLIKVRKKYIEELNTQEQFL